MNSLFRFVPVAILALQGISFAQAQPQFRPPAVPLVTSDPYLSIWSENNTLTGGPTRHWTRHPNRLVSMVRVDGTAYRIMGDTPTDAPAMKQTSLKVTATRTTYIFKGAGVKVTLEFLTPLLPNDLKVYSRPVTYLTWTVKAIDGKKHSVELYDSSDAEVSVNDTSEKVVWKRTHTGPLTLLRAGAANPTLLEPMGDDTRINWGYLYAAALSGDASSTIAPSAASEAQFVAKGTIPPISTSKPTVVADVHPSLAFDFQLGKVGSKPVSRQVMIGYDEIYSIYYFGQNLRPYWRKDGATPATLFTAAMHDYKSLDKKSAAFDAKISADATKVGGAKYAQIVSLAYRECVAANGLAADANGQPLLFTKENTSNGDIATVDVIFPMDPIWVLLSPTLAKASLQSNFEYAASSHWKFENAPHDLGTYPRAFGRDDGGEGMPVEESGNMIILTDAIAQAEGSAEYAKQWWPQLTQWATYLQKYGLDPEDQLCTDDFMGHLAHNANLSVKAILALAAYGDLCERTGKPVEAAKYKAMAKADALHWMKVADGGNHSLLAFDKPGTWSQKYNLVWDRILGLNVFPSSVAKKEIAFYKTQMQPYGLPLDSRTKLTKTDWTVWSATMAPSISDFEGFINPIYRYLNETTTRDPISDSYITNDVHSGGMHARPVVGGLFIRLLTNKAIWKSWARKDKTMAGPWAPLPKPPKVVELVPTARTAKVMWAYTTTDPGAGWTAPGFEASAWSRGVGGFGTAGTPSAIVGTTWNTDDIWLRRHFTAPTGSFAHLQMLAYHDEDIQVYFNGILAMSAAGYDNNYSLYKISPAAMAVLKKGGLITMAVHCHQTTGGQGVDAGIVRVIPQK